MKHVILCDKTGTAHGTDDVLEAHQNGGSLHRAFSVFVFRNDGNEILVQQRSEKKPLFPLFWANTCCSHPQEGEDLIQAAQNRLQEELGFSCELEERASFVYQADDPNGDLSEHEYDTILVGSVDGDIEVKPDPEEVAAWKWMTLEELQIDIDENPDAYAPWFLIALSLLFDGK